MATTAAKRYAKGLLQVGIQTNETDSLLADMQMIGEAMKSTPMLHKTLISPVVKDKVKVSVLKEIFSTKISDTTIRLIDILADKKRLGLLQDVTKSFIELYNQHAGILEINILTAYELDQRQIDKIVGAISATTGKKIKHSIKIDKSLMGGVAIKYGDTVIDGSVRNRLEQLAGLLHTSTV